MKKTKHKKHKLRKPSKKWFVDNFIKQTQIDYELRGSEIIFNCKVYKKEPQEIVRSFESFLDNLLNENLKKSCSREEKNNQIYIARSLMNQATKILNHVGCV